MIQDSYYCVSGRKILSGPEGIDTRNVTVSASGSFMTLPVRSMAPASGEAIEFICRYFSGGKLPPVNPAPVKPESGGFTGDIAREFSQGQAHQIWDPPE